MIRFDVQITEKQSNQYLFPNEEIAVLDRSHQTQQ